jgi:hypothetical protein
VKVNAQEYLTQGEPLPFPHAIDDSVAASWPEPETFRIETECDFVSMARAHRTLSAGDLALAATFVLPATQARTSSRPPDNFHSDRVLAQNTGISCDDRVSFLFRRLVVG